MNPKPLAGEIDRELRTLGTPERAKNEKAYLKSDLEFMGVTVPQIREVAKRVRTAKSLAHDELIALVEELWRKPVHERRTIAVEFLGMYKATLEARDIDLVERLIRESRTWALVDPLAEHIAGGLVAREPKLTRVLDRWASDEDFWVRRSSMLALLGPLRRGGGDFDRFAGYADQMLEDREFFIRKAIGWILREASKKQPETVFAWLEPRAARASGVTLREAVKYLPPGQREQILARARTKD